MSSEWDEGGKTGNEGHPVTSYKGLNKITRRKKGQLFPREKKRRRLSGIEESGGTNNPSRALQRSITRGGGKSSDRTSDVVDEL